MDNAKREKLLHLAGERLLSGLLQGVKKTGPGQYLARCISGQHEDRNPSLSIGTDAGAFQCLANCGFKGDNLTLYARARGLELPAALAELEEAAGIGKPVTKKATATKKAAPGAVATSLENKGAKVKGPVKYVPRVEWEALPTLPENWLSKLERLKVCTRESVSRLGLRLWRKGKQERLAIPIHQGGELVNVRLYLPGGDPKMISWGQGFGTARLFPSPDTWRNDAPLFLLEGEPDTLSAISFLGLNACTVTSGAGIWSPDFTEHFRGREVVIGYDADSAGKNGREKIVNILSPVVKSLAVIKWPETWGTAEDRRKDVKDFILDGGTLEGLQALIAPVALPSYLPPSPEVVKRRLKASRSQGESPEGERAPRGADRLLALFWDCPLYLDTAGGTYIDLDGRLFPLEQKNRELRELLTYTAHESGKGAGGEAVNQAIAVLSHRARIEGACLELFTRTGEENGAFFYDLGNSRAVEITPAGWRIVTRPLWFRSFTHQLPQPDPQPGGDPWRFFDFVNVEPESRLLALCFLVTLFVPRITRPLIHLFGCQGAGKSFAARLLKTLFDPSAVVLSSVPRKDEDLDILLFKNALLCLDNLSYLPPAMADRLCAFISGATIERRALFTDLDTTVLPSGCAVCVSSITDLHGRPDLAERTLRLTLDRIPREKRRTERELLAEFDAALPGILGGLLDLLARAMRIQPTVTLRELPRMADFSVFSYAVAEAVEPGRGRDFMRLYAENGALQSHSLLDGDSLFSAIVVHLEGTGTLAGTFKDCLNTLTEAAKPDPKDSTFPRSPNGFRSHLARLEAPLEEAGIVYEIDTHRTAARRSWVEFRRKDRAPEPPPPELEGIVFDEGELPP